MQKSILLECFAELVAIQQEPNPTQIISRWSFSEARSTLDVSLLTGQDQHDNSDFEKSKPVAILRLKHDMPQRRFLDTLRVDVSSQDDEGRLTCFPDAI